MVQAFAVQESIDLPNERVWQELTAWERAPAWMAGVEAMRAEGPTAAGTVVRFTARGTERASTITACEPGRSLTLTTARGPVSASYTYALAAEDAGTRASLVVDVTTKGIARAFTPMLSRAMRRADGGQLRELRRVLEKESAAS